MTDILINWGSAVRALGDGKVGGYGITFEGSDLEGDFFTAKTYLGAHEGNGVDCLFHHSLPVQGIKSEFCEHLFQPVKTTRDDIGVFVETVMDMNDQYERAVYKLAQEGKLGWSSGAPAHMVRRAKSGEFTRWPIAEFSLTPTPAEPRNKVVSIKTLKTSGLSADDKRALLSKALYDQKWDGEYDCWVCDVYDTSVVYAKNGMCYEASYTLDGMNVTLGQPEAVQRVVTYKPLPNGSAKSLVKTERDFEAFLRDAGFPRSQSVAITLHGYKALSQRDAEEAKSAQRIAYARALESSLMTGVGL